MGSKKHKSQQQNTGSFRGQQQAYGPGSAPRVVKPHPPLPPAPAPAPAAPSSAGSWGYSLPTVRKWGKSQSYHSSGTQFYSAYTNVTVRIGLDNGRRHYIEGYGSSEYSVPAEFESDLNDTMAEMERMVYVVESAIEKATNLMNMAVASRAMSNMRITASSTSAAFQAISSYMTMHPGISGVPVPTFTMVAEEDLEGVASSDFMVLFEGQGGLPDLDLGYCQGVGATTLVRVALSGATRRMKHWNEATRETFWSMLPEWRQGVDNLEDMVLTLGL